MHKKLVLAAAIVMATSALAFWAVHKTAPSHALHLKAYFARPDGLRRGGEVRLNGVVVGQVTDIRVRADLSQNPVEVLMLLQTPYELKLPADAVASVETSGVLDPSFAEIDTKEAKGTPVSDNATLRTVSFSLPE